MRARVAVVVVWGLVLGLHPQPVRAESGDPANGKAVFERYCVACHGAQGKGDGPAGQMMTPRPADFTSPKIKAKPDGELLKSIQDGRPPTPMPAFKSQLTGQQISDVLAYVRSLGR